MTPAVWVAILSALLANAVGLGAVLIRIGAIAQRIDLVWAWYLVEHGVDVRHGDRMITPREMREAFGPPGNGRADVPRGRVERN